MKLVEVLILAGVSAAIASGGAVVKISKDRKEAKRKLEQYTEEEKEAERQIKEKATEEGIERREQP